MLFSSENKFLNVYLNNILVIDANISNILKNSYVKNINISLEVSQNVKKDICVTWASIFEKHYNSLCILIMLKS